MIGREFDYVPPEAAEFKAPQIHTTPDAVRRKVDLGLKIFSQFEVDGLERLTQDQEANPDAKYIIASPHFSGHDVQSAIKALGGRLDIQVTGESLVQDEPIPKFLINQIGQDRFTPLSYSKEGGKKHGVFQPHDFDPLVKLMKEGRTPWVAVHPFSMEERMQEEKVGPVYLAHKAGAKILPTAVEVTGASVRFITGGDYLKQVVGKLTGKAKAVYHVGEPIELPKTDISIIDTVMAKRANKEKVTNDERQKFHEVVEGLRGQAKLVAKRIAEMLPEKHQPEAAET